MLRLAGPGLLAVLFALFGLGAAAAEAASVHVTGTVTNQSGSGVQNVSVTATDPGGTTVDFGPSFTAADGSYQLDVDPGTYDFHFVLAGGAYNPVVFNNFTVFTDQVLSVQFTPVIHQLSGTVRDAAGNPVGGVQVSYNVADNSIGGTGTSDNSGHYSMQLPAGVYGLVQVSTVNATNAATIGKFVYSPSTLPVAITNDLTAGDAVAQDVYLPSMATVTVLVKDSLGNPVINASVTSRPSFSPTGSHLVIGTTSLVSSNNPWETSGYTTDGSGLVHFMVPVTTTFGQQDGATSQNGNLCTYGPNTVICLPAPLTVSGDITILFQPQPQIPDAPMGLSAVTPTSNAPALAWNPVNGAVNYRVFRDGAQVGITTDPNFVDSALSVSGSYSYTVQSVNAQDVASMSSAAFVVMYDATKPTISYSLAPSANGAGWNKGNVTVTFTCADALSGVASCTSPVTFASEGNNQTVTGTAVDNAGNSATVTVTVRVDKTIPTVGAATWSANPKPVGTLQAPVNTTITVPAADALSGVAGGEYFIDTDPGEGNGVTMSFAGGSLSATFGAGLATGVYDVGVRSRDAAGNWSSVLHSQLVVYDPTITGVTGKNQHGFSPNPSSDVLPFLSSSLVGSADFGFTVDWLAGGQLDPANEFHLNYTTGTNCGTPHPQNCHVVSLVSSAINQLIIDQTGNSRARFNGSVNLAIDGTTTVNPFTVTAVDGDQLSTNQPDTFALNIYAPDADPATATALYHVSVVFSKGNDIRIR
ncbi:MAG TPA: carboxypeptidase-like regulatory domain-containing protein [Candidatus Saccharimonadia bacterium]|nr:carboxypeptidase-like regulatory domain-containing protein [Candidatus Saccharimonadia bacterium]